MANPFLRDKKKKRVRHFAKRYGNNIDINLVFSSFEIGNMFSVKEPVKDPVETCFFFLFVVYFLKFVTYLLLFRQIFR